MNPPAFLFFKVVVAVNGSLDFRVIVRSAFQFLQRRHGIIGIVLNLYTDFGIVPF